MRRARRTPAITPELSTQQKISRLEGTPPGWANLQTADGGAPLRIIRGRVDTGGPGIGAGGGFTLTRNGVGDLTVTFSTAFSAVPAVTATPERTIGGHNLLVNLVNGGAAAGSARFLVTDANAAFAASDGYFNFIAIGPA